MGNDPADTLDWEEVWCRQYEKATFQLGGKDFNVRADCWDRAMRGNTNSPYVEVLLERMNLSPETSVLDVGCGSGIVAIPMAKKVHRVTALDQAAAMLELTRQYAQQNGVSNVVTIERDWLEVEVGKDLEIHDIVLASRCLQMAGLRRFLIQMDRAAQKRCYLTWGMGGREDDAEICAVLGIPYRPQPSYWVVYNLLYDLGILANVEIHTHPVTRWFRDLDESVAGLLRGRPVDPEAGERLKAYFKEKLPFRDDRYWKVIHAPWALISWNKEGAKRFML